MLLPTRQTLAFIVKRASTECCSKCRIRPRRGLAHAGQECSAHKDLRPITAVPNLTAIRREYNNRDDAIRIAYESGLYSYQQIAKEFEIQFTTVGRIVRQPTKRINVITGEGDRTCPLCCDDRPEPNEGGGHDRSSCVVPFVATLGEELQRNYQLIVNMGSTALSEYIGGHHNDLILSHRLQLMYWYRDDTCAAVEVDLPLKRVALLSVPNMLFVR